MSLSFLYDVSPPSSENALVISTKPKLKRSARVPGFFRLWFTWVEPLINALRICTTTILYFNRTPYHGYERSHLFVSNLAFQLAAALTTICFLQIFLLRHTEDPQVWRLFQQALLLYDLSHIKDLILSMHYNKGYKYYPDWWNENWNMLAFPLFTAGLRILFILEVGTLWRRKTRLALRWFCVSINCFLGRLERALEE